VHGRHKAGHAGREKWWTKCETVIPPRRLSAAALLRRPCRGRSDDPVELSLWPGDRGSNAGHDIQLQPLDVVVKTMGCCDILRRRSAGGGPPYPALTDLLLRQIRDHHVVAVVETIDVVGSVL
jgi:hypothetical protein